MKKVDKVINKIALPILAIAAMLLILVFVLGIKSKNEENNGYIRVINCIISIPATTRTQGDIESCYQTVENQTGVKLQRYDTSNN